VTASDAVEPGLLIGAKCRSDVLTGVRAKYRSEACQTMRSHASDLYLALAPVSTSDLHLAPMSSPCSTASLTVKGAVFTTASTCSQYLHIQPRPWLVMQQTWQSYFAQLARTIAVDSEIKSSRHGLTETLQQLICMLSVVSNAIKQAHCTTFHHNSAKATCNNRVDSSKPHACTQLLFSARSRELHSKICHHRTDSYHTFNTIKKARQGQDLRLVTGYQQSQSTAADSGLDGIPDMPQVLCP